MLSEKQDKFTGMIADFIQRVRALGYEITFGEAYRTPEQAALNAKKGTGIKNSLHTVRLAVDFNVFKDGEYLTGTGELETIGIIWEHLGGTWGGRFGDGNHFSLEHNGVK